MDGRSRRETNERSPEPAPHHESSPSGRTNSGLTRLNGPGLAAVILGALGVMVPDGRGSEWVLGAAAIVFGAVGLRRLRGRAIAIVGVAIGLLAIGLAVARAVG